MVARVRAGAWVAALALSAAPRVAEAAPVLRVEWPTLPGCPSSSAVLERARVATSRTNGVDDVYAVAEVTPPSAEGEPWQLYIRTRTVRGAGERTLEAPSCDAVARAVAMIVGIASLRTRAPATEHTLDELTPAPDHVEDAGPLVAPLAPVRPPKDAANAVTASAEKPITRLVPSAELGVAIGLLPRIAPTASVGLGYEAGWLRARLAFRALLPQEVLDRGRGAELGAFGVSFDGCGRLPVTPVLRAKPHACAGAMLDNVRAHGIGADAGVEAFEVWRVAMMAFAGVGATWDLGRAFRIGADARLGGSVLRPTFVIDSASDGQRQFHRPALVRAESTLTFGMVF
ncbi:MAG: hypothetical protein BGO98_24215 [Myxococcales bacterium 68-20]|nr:hypothetical protein [Myxococcales bacterium]OJY15778.1 MAG: hypothetical protein BGO98_24215 [Myxococcales bacterium 68-20]